MPRVAPAERARKETAFEALEVALKAAGRNNRPNENQRGYPAVTQAILWWKDVSRWEELSADEQRLSLVSHSNWRTYRRKRGVRSPDLDVAKFEVYKVELARLLRGGPGGVAGSGAAVQKHAPHPSLTDAHDLMAVAASPAVPMQPVPPPPPPSTLPPGYEPPPPMPQPSPPTQLSFSGSAAGFAEWTRRQLPPPGPDPAPDQSKKRRLEGSIIEHVHGAGCGHRAVWHTEAGAAGEAHVDYIDENGELFCTKRPRKVRRARRLEAYLFDNIIVTPPTPFPTLVPQTSFSMPARSPWNCSDCNDAHLGLAFDSMAVSAKSAASYREAPRLMHDGHHDRLVRGARGECDARAGAGAGAGTLTHTTHRTHNSS